MAKFLLDNSNKSPIIKSELIPKLNNVYEDYEIKEEILGKGLNGKIRLCIHKASQQRYALKVCFFNLILSIFDQKIR